MRPEDVEGLRDGGRLEAENESPLKRLLLGLLQGGPERWALDGE